MYYAYLLRCADGTIYSGYAADLAQRLKAHNEGRGAKYTRARLPVALAHSEAFASKSEAMRRESAFKRMTRTQKLALCAADCADCPSAAAPAFSSFPRP